MIPRRKTGFSLIELIVVIAVMAAIAAVIVPAIGGTREAAEEQAAIAAAGTLNLAQVQYRLEHGTATWTATGTNEGRYNLIQPYMEYNESWAAFSARYPNYTFAFQGLDNQGKMQKVALTRTADNHQINY